MGYLLGYALNLETGYPDKITYITPVVKYLIIVITWRDYIQLMIAI